MKATITQENFAKALNYVSKTISSNPSIPVLSNVLVEVSKDEVKLSTTDLELGISTSIGADVKKEGKTTANAKTLSEFVNTLTPGKIDIELKEKLLVVQNESNSAEFNIVEADEFPPLPKSKDKYSFSANLGNFADSINKVVFSAASDDSRPVLTGILFEATNKKLTMVAVDGFRLSREIIDINRTSKSKFSYIVPARALSELSRIAHDLEEDEGDVEVYLLNDKNQMIFRLDNVEISTRLIEGEFPEYQQILPKETKHKFSIDKDSLERTIRIVSIFARSAVGNKAVFELDSKKKTLKLSAQVADVGENESSVQIQNVSGESFQTGYNIRFLQDMINAIDGEEIDFETNGVTAPGVFKDKEDKNFLHIIMPMRLD